MLINEYRLNPLDPNARKYLGEEMEKFLFGGEFAKPAGYSRTGRRGLTKTRAFGLMRGSMYDRSRSRQRVLAG